MPAIPLHLRTVPMPISVWVAMRSVRMRRSLSIQPVRAFTPGNSRDRMVLLEKNVDVMNDIMETDYAVTPKDAIHYRCFQSAGYSDLYCAEEISIIPANKIFGTGTLLDTAQI